MSASAHVHGSIGDEFGLVLRETIAENKRLKALEDRKCVWAESNGDAEFWHTDCDQDFVFIEGCPSENGMRFCCYCGANLVEKKWEEPPDAEDLSTV